MSLMNHKVDPLNEERSVIDNLIASSQNLMGSAENPVSQQCPTPLDYQMTTSKSKMMMKSRRGRTSFTPGQLSDLEAAFANTHYPDFQSRKELSNRLKIPDDRIQVWFQNRRAKWRKNQRQVNGSTLVSGYHGNHTLARSSGNPAHAQKCPPNEIPLGFNLNRPSPIQHTGSVVKSESNFTTVHCAASQTNTTESKNLACTFSGQQPTFGNLVKTYEKLTAPHTSAELKISDNERTAPSLYSLSAAVTSTGQYIILGTSSNQPAGYPRNCNNYSVEVPSENHKY